MTLAFSLNHTIEIHARRPAVFRFFTDSARFAKWQGAGSTIDPVVGGAVKIQLPGGITTSGVIRELVPDRVIVFTYGYDDPQKPIAPGGSVVTVTLSDVASGTRVALRHEVADKAARDSHIQGWRHQLAVFAHIVVADGFSPTAVEQWFAAWNEPDPRLEGVVTQNVTFRDANGCVSGIHELVGHLAAVRMYMPGIKLELVGALRHEQGTVLAEWAYVRDGKSLATGTNVFRLDADGRIAECIAVAR
jgi:uncharacterized protein YndB with AHSA1/START domain